MASMIGGCLPRGALRFLMASMLLLLWERKRCWNHMDSNTSDLDVWKYKVTKTGRPQKGFSFPWIYKIFLQFTVRMKKQKHSKYQWGVVLPNGELSLKKLKLKESQTLHFCSVPEEIHAFIGHKNGFIPGTANLTPSTPLGSRATDADLLKLEYNIKTWMQYTLFQHWLC